MNAQNAHNIENGHGAAARIGREVTNCVFPWPQTILKQLEEWHVIVSCDQLGETLRAAPTLPFKMVITFVCLVSVLLLLSNMAVFYHV